MNLVGAYKSSVPKFSKCKKGATTVLGLMSDTLEIFPNVRNSYQVSGLK
jgi:hypothetical protein